MMRRTIAVLFMLASFMVQVQVIYACTQMDMQGQSDCCCEYVGNNSCTIEIDSESPCCDTQFSFTQSHSVSNKNGLPHNESVAENTTFSPHLPTSYVYRDPVRPIIFANTYPSATFWAHHSDIYLITQRFRE